jgi:hypothetical protein
VILFARHVVYLGGGSPLWAAMAGTTARSKGVRREPESEGSVRQDSDATNKSQIEGLRSEVTRRETGDLIVIRHAAGVNPAGTRGKTHD